MQGRRQFRNGDLPVGLGSPLKALLLSGGMDSTALAAWKRPDVAITINYGQLAAATEVAAARQISKMLGIDHEVIAADCSALGSGDMAIGKPIDLAPVSDWWPFRNQLLITLAAMRCVALGVKELMIATVATDGSHADGRKEFFEAMNTLLAVQEGGLSIIAPALSLTTEELITRSTIDPAVLGWAHSCHIGIVACGQCRGCVKHIEVTHALGGEAY
ncbi:7-cyano-7-deazaguanine synthase [Erythrobacter sp. MTPC3]|uniref:7-cyano-7-deazaguanine synthase n=1 Tax=Erythrobacter sp. MTPC3 TaxID=3056564 RepID=UPI0036F1F77A